MRTTGAPISRAEILLPVNASNSVYMEARQQVNQSFFLEKIIKRVNNPKAASSTQLTLKNA